MSIWLPRLRINHRRSLDPRSVSSHHRSISQHPAAILQRIQLAAVVDFSPARHGAIGNSSADSSRDGVTDSVGKYSPEFRPATTGPASARLYPANRPRLRTDRPPRSGRRRLQPGRRHRLRRKLQPRTPPRHDRSSLRPPTDRASAQIDHHDPSTANAYNSPCDRP